MRDYFIQRLTKTMKTLKKLQLLCLVLSILITAGVILGGVFNRSHPKTISSIAQLSTVPSYRYVSITSSQFTETGNFIYEKDKNVTEVTEENVHILSREYLITLEDGFVFAWSRNDYSTEAGNEVVFKGSVVKNPRYDDYLEEIEQIDGVSRARAKQLLSPYMIDIHSNEWYYLFLIVALLLMIGYFYCKPLIYRNKKILFRLQQNNDTSHLENFEETLIKDKQLLWSHSWVFNLSVFKQIVYHYNEVVWIYKYNQYDKRRLFVYFNDQQLLVVEDAIDELFERILSVNPNVKSDFEQVFLDAFLQMNPKQWIEWIREYHQEKQEEWERQDDTKQL